MVFFTCNNCGESVKKPAVEKHYNSRCRGAPKNVSCMDCQKDFRGEEYVAHIKCITEAEKYSGKDYVAKEAKNSGAKKQESWMDIIRSILESSDYQLNAQTRSAFQRLQSVDNVPRKKAKFQNFVSNCMRMPRNQAEEVWNVLEKELEKMKQERQKEVAEAKEAQEAAKKQKEAASQQNGTKRVATEENGHVASKKSKKSKSVENGEQNGHDEPAKKKSKKQKLAEIIADAEPSAAETTSDVDEEFQWTACLEKIVGKHTEGISLDKLKKKLLKKYVAKLGAEGLSEKQQKKFEKKFSKNVKKCAAVQVDGEVAKPC